MASAQRNAEAISAMGMLPDLTRVWRETHSGLLNVTQNAADRNAAYTAVSRTLRLILQSAILGVGAYLVIGNELSPGALIAASIIFARALAPIDGAIGQWRSVAAARQSWRRLRQAVQGVQHTSNGLELPAPARTLTLDGVAVAPPGAQSSIVAGVTFTLAAGEGVGVIGASGSGKSTLLRGIVGAWPISGELRLDGATPDQWTAAARGSFIGYLPQDIELLSGTVAENIARFRSDATDTAVIAAAELAGVHELIVSLPDGYETRVGVDGVTLSAGQRQRVALARAVYGEPFIVVLDEPNSNLDADGEVALSQAIAALRARNCIVVVAAHRKAAIANLDKLLYLKAGQAVAFGDKERVLAHVRAEGAAPPGGLRVVGS